MGEGGSVGTLNRITEPMGVAFVGRLLASGTHTDYGDFDVKVNSTNSLLRGVSAMTMHQVTAIRVQGPAIAIVSTDASTWLELNDNGIKDNSEQEGPFPIAAQIQYGQGRVVIYLNSAWGGYFGGDAATFLLQALAWSVTPTP